ncbi:MAG: DUF481 domain-containing protein [Melioribacteraceae bacterium]|nr:DUF481 domain-containing protein [Melioribacteraceae bacterium]
MAKIKILLFIVFLTNITAQINTEKYRSTGEELGTKFFLDITATFEYGNTEKREAEFQGQLDHLTESYNLIFAGKGEYNFTDKSEFANYGLLHLRFIKIIDEEFKWEFYTQANYDVVRKVKLRYLAGLGLRTKLFTLDKSNFWIGSSFMFEKEKFDIPSSASHEVNPSQFRWSNYLTYKVQLKDDLLISSVIYYQPMFKDFSDSKLLNETTIKIDINTTLSLKVEQIFRYDTNPPDGVKKFDSKSTFGLVLTF